MALLRPRASASVRASCGVVISASRPLLRLAQVVNRHRASAAGRQRDGTDRKSDQVGRMGVHDSHHVGPRAVDRRVDEALLVLIRSRRPNRLAREVVLDDIGGEYQGGRHVTGDVEAFRVAAAPGADVAVRIKNVHMLGREYAVRDDEVVDQRRLGLRVGLSDQVSDGQQTHGPDQEGSFHDDDP